MSKQQQPVYSRFPFRILNALMGGNSDGYYSWRAPATSMPRCRIVLAVPKRLIALRSSMDKDLIPARYYVDAYNETYMYRCTRKGRSERPRHRVAETPPTLNRGTRAMVVSGPRLREAIDPPGVGGRVHPGAPVKTSATATRQYYCNREKWWRYLLQEGFVEQCQLSELDHVARGHIISKVRVGSEKGVDTLPEGRLIVDFRYLNGRSARRMNGYLPKLCVSRELVIAAAASAKCFMQGDLKSSFYCVPVHPKSKRFLGIEQGTRLARFNVVPMGISDGSDCLAAWLEWVLSHLPPHDRRGIHAYQDDLLVVGSSFEECYARFMRLTVLLGFFHASFNHAKVTQPMQSEIGVRVLGAHLRCAAPRRGSVGRLTFTPAFRSKLEGYVGKALAMIDGRGTALRLRASPRSTMAEADPRRCHREDHERSLPYDAVRHLDGLLNCCNFFIPRYWETVFPLSLACATRSPGCLTKESTRALRRSQKEALSLLCTQLKDASSHFLLCSADPHEDLELYFRLFLISDTVAWEALLTQLTYGNDKRYTALISGRTPTVALGQPRVLWRFHGIDRTTSCCTLGFPCPPTDETARRGPADPLRLLRCIYRTLRRALPVLTGIQKSRHTFGASRTRALRAYVHDTHTLKRLRRTETQNSSSITDAYIQRIHRLRTSQYDPLGLPLIFDRPVIL